MTISDEIERLRADNERLRVENIQMRFALGYPMPADLEHHILPSNPFKCGTCDANSRLRAENERLRAALETISLMDKKHEHDLFSATQVARAALAAQPAPSGWRPIETAPKDGTEVLMVFVFEDGDTFYDVVHWDGVKSWPWRTAYTGYGEKNAKGWMPLPPAPGKEEA